MQSYFKDTEFEVIAEVGQGIALPSKEKYTVMIQIGDLVLKSEKPVVAENTYNRWSFRFKQTTYKCPYKNLSDMGRVYLYLMQGDKPICYFKDHVENYSNPDAQWKWVELINDLSIGKVTDANKAGLLSFKLSIHNKTKDGPI